MANRINGSPRRLGGAFHRSSRVCGPRTYLPIHIVPSKIYAPNFHFDDLQRVAAFQKLDSDRNFQALNRKLACICVVVGQQHIPKFSANSRVGTSPFDFLRGCLSPMNDMTHGSQGNMADPNHMRGAYRPSSMRVDSLTQSNTHSETTTRGCLSDRLPKSVSNRRKYEHGQLRSDLPQPRHTTKVNDNVREIRIHHGIRYLSLAEAEISADNILLDERFGFIGRKVKRVAGILSEV